MIKSIYSSIPSATLFITLVLLIACGGEDNPEINTSDYISTVSSINDVGDNGDPSDVSVTFSIAKANENISEYRIFYIKSNSTTVVTETSLSSVSSNYYTSAVGNGQTITTSLNSNQLSIDDETIINDEDYQIYILSIGKFNDEQVMVLSNISTDFRLIDTSILNIENYTVQILSAKDDDNNGIPSDILVTFSGPVAETQIQEYRIITVQSSSVSLVTLEVSKDLNSANFYSVLNDQTNYSVKLPNSQRDFEGNSIDQETDYQILILSIGMFEDELVYALSAPTSSFLLQQKPETTTLVSNFIGNDALSVDANGNIYASNYGIYEGTGGNGTAALRVTPTGSATEFVSNLSGPLGNAVDDSGNFFVVNGNNNASGQLLKIEANGSQSSIATINGFPSGLLLGNDGNFYVSNYSQPVVNRVTPAGAITVFATDSRLNGGVGIVYDDSGNVLVGNFKTGDILSIDPNGAVSLIAIIPTVVTNFVIGYITYFEDHIYATGIRSNIIYKVSLSGNITQFAGNGTATSIDDELSRSSFISPNGITVDKTRRILYVSEGGLSPGEGKLRSIPLD